MNNLNTTNMKTNFTIIKQQLIRDQKIMLIASEDNENYYVVNCDCLTGTNTIFDCVNILEAKRLYKFYVQQEFNYLSMCN